MLELPGDSWINAPRSNRLALQRQQHCIQRRIRYKRRLARQQEIEYGSKAVHIRCRCEQTGTTSGLILHLLAGAVVAPIAEEIVFRGVAVTAWSRTNGAWVAIVRAAILFAGAHVLLVGGQSFGDAASLAIVGAAARLPVALALGWIYLRQGTIWSAIGLHATFNAVLLLLAERAVIGG